ALPSPLLCSCCIPPPPRSPPFPYTTLFRSVQGLEPAPRGVRAGAEDLRVPQVLRLADRAAVVAVEEVEHRVGQALGRVEPAPVLDRKSTRLNSSHVKISYAVFCLKKKTETG